MGFWSSVGGFLGSVCSGIGEVCSKIGGALATGIGALAGALAPILSTVAPIISAIASLIGVFKNEHTPEDYGEAMQKAEKKPDDFDSINEYIAYLDEEISSGRIQLDEKEKKTDIQKNIDTAIGSALGMKGISEKYNLEDSVSFWATMGQKFKDEKIDEKELVSTLETMSEKDISADDVSAYLEDKTLETNSKSEVSEALKQGLEKANPELSKDELTTKFNELLKS
ncbi:hypothetical protein DMB92_04060 [Campylobacter sp. MIT 99-7217]|uniref:hypothetical protein n=1 Tax=Campylobacter sp. MIT 99-7217 TaxID=535091 RepID=UPI00115751F9|nr:hypothetical protein [Campylobacter sp. MIT 99-7217]TQR33139.1 hypothetical protein DMB92_04060 [Campylobacter sp. MIT 99-7217]